MKKNELDKILNLVVNLISWSGLPHDADDDDVVITGETQAEDILYGDLKDVSHFVTSLKREIEMKKGVVTFTDED